MRKPTNHIACIERDTLMLKWAQEATNPTDPHPNPEFVRRCQLRAAASLLRHVAALLDRGASNA